MTTRLFVALMLVMLLPAMTLAATFSDVSSERADAAAIARFVTAGYVAGYPDGTFQPDRQVNRAEALKFILTIAGIAAKKSATSQFADVDKNAWFAPFVMTAMTRGIVSGAAADRFEPARIVSRAELLKMLFAAHGLYVSPRVVIDAPDVAEGAWYVPYLALGAQTGLAKPSGKNFEPGHPLTRGEVVVLLDAFLAKKNSITTQSLLNQSEDALIVALKAVGETRAGDARTAATTALTAATTAAGLSPSQSTVAVAVTLATAVDHLTRALATPASRTTEAAAAESALATLPTGEDGASIASTIALIRQQLARVK